MKHRRMSLPTLTTRRFSSSQDGYDSTLKNLKIGKHTRVIFQGFTGKSDHTQSSPVQQQLTYGQVDRQGSSYHRGFRKAAS